MATTVQEIIRRVRYLIQDFAGVRWTDDELLLWVNDGQRDIVVYKPDAYAVRESLTCVAGTRQALPASAVQLLDVPHNVASPKRTIRPLDRRVLDMERPGWRGEASSSTIRYFVYDADTPTEFDVYPPATVNTQIQVLYADTPPTLTIEDELSIAEIYSPALVDYICFRCYMKDAMYNANSEKAKLHFEAYFAALTGKRTAEDQSAPSQATGDSKDAV